MIRSIKILISCLCLGALASSFALGYPDGKVVLKKAMENEPRQRYEGIYLSQFMRRDQLITGRMKIMRNGSQGFRLQFLSPPQLSGGVMVDDGTRFLHRPPKNKPPRIGPSHADRPLMVLFPGRPFFIPLKNNLKITTLGKERINGRPTWKIEISLPSTPQPRRRLWIDTERYIPLQSAVLGPDGNVICRSYFERIDFTPHFNRKDFNFKAPANAQRMMPFGGGTMSLSEVKTKAPFDVSVPSWLPSDFKLVGASVLNSRRWGTLVRLRYGNGFAAMTLFQTKSARPPRELPSNVKSKNIDGVNITMVGSGMSQETEQKIFDSIH
jgi:hypothetical protein